MFKRIQFKIYSFMYKICNADLASVGIKVKEQLRNFLQDVLPSNIRGAFGKFLAWPFISVTDLQTLSCLVSFSRTIFPLYYDTNVMRIL